MQVHACCEALFVTRKTRTDRQNVVDLLQNERWVLLQQNPLRLVYARQLCFGAEEDQFEGYFPVPRELLELVQKFSSVYGKELLVKMGTIDVTASYLPQAVRTHVTGAT